jgi:hypothetical protein
MSVRVPVRVALAFGLWAQSLSAASPQMVELNDCGKWLQARQAKSAWALQGYVVGILTGMIEATGVSLLGASPQAAISNEQIYFWVDEYCRKDPLKNLEEAMPAFADEVSHGAYQQAVNRAIGK